ncbi:MAG: transporter substrate-binding domain-containing protein [Nitratireductor sp.]|jgi:polar amino acid transport system substrate-binding protein|nr:transporter substrate-binding domain-containing protein [Nitratireductor sp.]
MRFKGFCFGMLLAAFVAASLAAPICASAQSQAIPNFWPRGEVLSKPDISSLQRLRFLTTTDFPPFNFIDRNKRLTGFHVDLARAICEELGILAKCQIQALPWDELEAALERGDGEAIIAGIEINAKTREKYEFSRPYLHVPGRFAARREAALAEPMTLAVRGKTTGVVEGSQHARWFADAFKGAQTRTFPGKAELFTALKEGKVDIVFTDAVSLSFWLVSNDSADCCAFAGGPYVSEDYFGHGMAIAFAKGRGDLAAAADYALKEINEKGTFAELYLRYFPLSLY